MAYKINLDKIIEPIILILVALMPFHTQVCEYLIPGGIDNLWRDILLVLGLILTLVGRGGKFNFGEYGVCILLMWFICIMYTAFSNNINSALNMGRTYLMPTLIYFIVINSKVDKEKILKIIIGVGTLLAIWGMFQAFVLKDTFLVNLGYPSINGHLSSSSFYISGFFGIQRVTSTFASPNIAGCYFGIILITMSYMSTSNHILNIMKLIVLAALITTFSRSAIIATVLVLVVKNIRDHDFSSLIKKTILIIPIACIILYLVDQYLLNGLVLRMLTSSINGVSSGTDASFQKHTTDITAFTNVINHPFGLGFGNNGPMANGFTENLVESSIYLLIYDFGIIGMLIFIFPYVKETVKFILGNGTLESSICVCLLITYIVLPNIETYEILFFVFLYLGLEFNAKYKK